MVENGNCVADAEHQVVRRLGAADDPAIGIARLVVERGPCRGVEDHYCADTGTGELTATDRRGVAAAVDRHRGGEQPLLAAAPDLGKNDLAGIAIDLRVVEHARIATQLALRCFFSCSSAWRTISPWIALIAAPMNVGRFSAAQSRERVVLSTEPWKRGIT